MAHWWQILRSFSMKPFHLKTTEVNVPRCPFFWAIRLDIGEPFPRNLANPKKKDRGESCCWGGRSSCPKTKNFYGKAKKNIEAQFWFIFFTLYNTRLGGFQFQSCLECLCLYLRNKHNNLTSIGLNGKWCWLSISVICRQDTSPPPISWLQGHSINVWVIGFPKFSPQGIQQSPLSWQMYWHNHFKIKMCSRYLKYLNLISFDSKYGSSVGIPCLMDMINDGLFRFIEGEQLGMVRLFPSRRSEFGPADLLQRSFCWWKKCYTIWDL